MPYRAMLEKLSKIPVRKRGGRFPKYDRPKSRLDGCKTKTKTCWSKTKTEVSIHTESKTWVLRTITGMNSASGGMWENKQTNKLYRLFIWPSYVIFVY